MKFLVLQLRLGVEEVSLGSISSQSTNSSKKNSSKSSFSSKAKPSSTPRSSSKLRDHNEPLTEPVVSETISQEFSFKSTCEAWKKEVSSLAALKPDDHYPYLINSSRLLLVRHECQWKADFRVTTPSADDRIPSYREG